MLWTLQAIFLCQAFPSSDSQPKSARTFSSTDLITRDKEVEWNPTHAKYYSRSLEYPQSASNPTVDHGLNDTVGCSRGGKPTGWMHVKYWRQAIRSECFCTFYHSAWYTGGPCYCWTPPTALFLVCRLVRQDALQVFFGQTKVIVVPSGLGNHRQEIEAPPARLAASIFLSDVIPKDGLRFLRSLELIFPPFMGPFSCTYCPPASPTQLDWIQTLTNVKSDLRTDRLAISVHFDLHFPAYHHIIMSGAQKFDSNEEFSPPITTTEMQAVKDTYTGTIAPLQALGKLRYFFAHLINPAYSMGRKERRYRKEWEEELECLVMGPDYDFAAAGKAKLVKDRWGADTVNKYEL